MGEVPLSRRSSFCPNCFQCLPCTSSRRQQKVAKVDRRDLPSAPPPHVKEKRKHQQVYHLVSPRPLALHPVPSISPVSGLSGHGSLPQILNRGGSYNTLWGPPPPSLRPFKLYHIRSNTTIAEAKSIWCLSPLTNMNVNNCLGRPMTPFTR